jgi:hypothetical protein
VNGSLETFALLYTDFFIDFATGEKLRDAVRPCPPGGLSKRLAPLLEFRTRLEHAVRTAEELSKYDMGSMSQSLRESERDPYVAMKAEEGTPFRQVKEEAVDDGEAPPLTS